MSDLKLPDEAATGALGAALAEGIAPACVLHLSGDLGAGKTTLVRGLLRRLGYAGRVKSPTYTLLEPYVLSRLHLYHFDFYRFKDRSEWLTSGFREYFDGSAACIVEWPERAAGLLSSPDLSIRLDFDGDARKAQIESHTPAGQSWLSSLRFPP
jgi:tRNA threonylcarbamoyladenosine biosynthesis protein TsaE